MLNKIKEFQKIAKDLNRDPNSMEELKLWLDAEKTKTADGEFFNETEEEETEETEKPEHAPDETEEQHEEHQEEEHEVSDEVKAFAEDLFEEWKEGQLSLKEVHHEIESAYGESEDEEACEDVIYEKIDAAFHELKNELEGGEENPEEEEVKELGEELNVEEEE